MQRPTMFLFALFVVAIAASAAIKLQFSGKTAVELGPSVRAETAQTGSSGQVGPGGSAGLSMSVAQGTADPQVSAIEAPPTSEGGASARPLPDNAMPQSDLEIRATSDAPLVVRFKAVQELGDFASSSAVQALSTVLRTDQALRVRLAAIQSLADIANANPGLALEVRAALEAVANDPNGNVSVASRQALSAIQ